MPIKCPDGSKPRYRWKGNVRLTFCGNTVVEVKKEGGEAKRVGKGRKGDGLLGYMGSPKFTNPFR